MDKEKLRNERFLRICFIDNELLVDVNNDIWEKILNQRERIVKIESSEWTWNLLTSEVVFH
jgi:hypothetical protein